MADRDNGFVSRHYVPLADLDPRLADAMLAVLAGESIAAYVAPSPGHVGGYLDVRLPDSPRDRLWVDRDHRDRAATLLREQAAAGGLLPPESPAAFAASGESVPAQADGYTEPALTSDTPGPDDDVWAELVASFDLPAYEDERHRASHGTGSGRGDAIADDDRPVPRRVVRPADRLPDDEPTPAAPNETSTGEWDPLDLLDEHFVPPTPPKAPAMSAPTRWAVAAIVAGLALIVTPQFSGFLPDHAPVLGALLLVGGVVSLIVRMRDDDPDDGPDDGAVV